MKKHALTTNEAADILGFARTSVINWVEKGELKSFLTPGGHRRFEMEDILAFAEKRGIQIAQKEESKDETKRVLVVDDDQDFRQFSLETLEIAGNFEVKEAANGIEAALITGSWKPHIILLDLHMPQMDGFEFCSIINQEYPHVKVQLMSGFADTNNTNLVDEDTLNALLPKPFSPIDLLKAVRELLDS